MGEPDCQINAIESATANALLSAVAAGDRQAFSDLYQQTSRLLYAIALRITRQAEQADEAVSETFLQVWRQASRFDPERGGAVAWLTVICRSRALDALRQRRQRDGLMTRLADELPGAEPCAAHLLASVELNSDLHAALSQLQEQQRQLVGLAYFRDYSHSELARSTGLPLGTVKSQLRRAVDKLRTLINRDSHD